MPQILTDLLLRALVIGICGTAAMDLWAIILHRVFKQPKPNWAPVGRWFLHVPRGKVFHEDIGQAAGFRFENAAGWIAHYVTGIVYGGALVLIAGPKWSANPTLLPALVLAWITVGAGWFLLQPGMGAGWAASKRPNLWKIRALNLVAHTWFGLGMWVGGLLLTLVY